MPIAATIEEKLTAAFRPLQLAIEDQSHRHAGHAGARPGGESHFKVFLVSQAFEGMNRLARQRAVYAALDEEMQGPIHMLSMTLMTPQEAA